MLNAILKTGQIRGDVTPISFMRWVRRPSHCSLLFAPCSPQVLFVHHYISMMHELGHTVARHAPGSASTNSNTGRAPANGDGRSNGGVRTDVHVGVNADGRGENGQNRTNGKETIAGNAAGVLETCGGGKTGGKEKDNEGLGGAQPALTIVGPRVVSEISEEDRRRPMRSLASNEFREELGCLPDGSRRTNAVSDVSTVQLPPIAGCAERF